MVLESSRQEIAGKILERFDLLIGAESDMHKSSIEKMKYFRERFLAQRARERLKICDLGSKAIGGSYREIFVNENWSYVGLDLTPGENVDLVLSDPYNWIEIDTESVDVIVSGQTFEHIEYFWETIREIARVLKPGGLCCIIAPSSGPEHKYPVDCWRFYPDGFKALARFAGLEPIEVTTDWFPPKYEDASEIWKDTIFVGRKPIREAHKTTTKHIYRREIKKNQEDSLSKIVRHIKPQSSVLELGPATGYLTRYLKENLGCRVECVEVCPEMAKEAERYSARMVVADLDDISIADEFGASNFDFVVLADVIEHVRDDVRLLKSCRKVLKESGECVISIPNIAHASILGELFCGRFEYSDEGLLDKTHVRFYTRSSILKRLKESSFCVKSVEPVIKLPEETEFGDSLSNLPLEVQRTILGLPDALAYQYVIVCFPGDKEASEYHTQPTSDVSALDLRRAVISGYESRISELEAAYEEARNLALERMEYINKLERALEETKKMALERLNRITEMERDFNQAQGKLKVYEEDVGFRLYWRAKNWLQRNLRRLHR